MNNLNTNDIDFNFIAHPVTGDISIKSGLDSLKQSLKNILMTSILERPFNTNLNLNINSYLFENFNIYYEDLIKQEITRIIEQYEQRVIINNLILNYKEEQNSLSIQLDFSAINESDINNTVELIVERIR